MAEKSLPPYGGSYDPEVHHEDTKGLKLGMPMLGVFVSKFYLPVAAIKF